MKYMSLLICLCVLGCSSLMDLGVSDTDINEEEMITQDENALMEETDLNVKVQPLESPVALTPEYHKKPMMKNVNDYAKWIAQDLFSNLDYPSNLDVFVISDFALLDSDLNETNHFGRQLTEALMHEVNITGFSVIDTKATGFIRITESGDVFFHSKDYTELAQKVPATNVIAGTLTKHKGGYLVNARIISMETMAMVSSAQAFVPYEVVEAVLLENPAAAISKKSSISEQYADKKNVEHEKSIKEEMLPKNADESSSEIETVGIPLTAYSQNNRG